MKYTAESPYGYWISKDDIIPVIQEESHGEVALEIIGRDFKHVSIYAVMFRLGYVRVVNYSDGDEYGVEYWKNAKLSKLQKEFVNGTKYIDTVTHVGKKSLERIDFIYML